MSYWPKRTMKEGRCGSTGWHIGCAYIDFGMDFGTDFGADLGADFGAEFGTDFKTVSFWLI